MDDRTLVQPTPSSAGERTLLQPAAGSACAVCETVNPPGAIWCGECGFRLDAEPGEGPAELPLAPIALTDAKGQRFPLRNGVMTLGRQGADLLFPEPSVSRIHAQLGVEPGAVWVEDLGSSNGTIVDGAVLKPNERRDLADGATLQLGDLTLTLEWNEETEGTEGTEEPQGTVDAEVLEATEDEAIPEPLAEESDDQADDQVAEEAVDEDEPALVGEDGVRFVLPEGVTTVGRRPGNNLILSDPFVSGRHATLSREDASLVVVDEGSTNGTRLNGARLSSGARAPLAEGDIVTFGETSLTFTWFR